MGTHDGIINYTIGQRKGIKISNPDPLYVIDIKAKKVKNIVKTGRTHLMDAMPITFDQELYAWKSQIDNNLFSLKSCCIRLNK